jgi:hypothetical protein
MLFLCSWCICICICIWCWAQTGRCIWCSNGESAASHLDFANVKFNPDCNSPDNVFVTQIQNIAHTNTNVKFNPDCNSPDNVFVTQIQNIAHTNTNVKFNPDCNSPDNVFVTQIQNIVQTNTKHCAHKYKTLSTQIQMSSSILTATTPVTQISCHYTQIENTNIHVYENINTQTSTWDKLTMYLWHKYTTLWKYKYN